MLAVSTVNQQLRSTTESFFSTVRAKDCAHLRESFLIALRLAATTLFHFADITVMVYDGSFDFATGTMARETMKAGSEAAVLPVSPAQ